MSKYASLDRSYILEPFWGQNSGLKETETLCVYKILSGLRIEVNFVCKTIQVIVLMDLYK